MKMKMKNEKWKMKNEKWKMKKFLKKVSKGPHAVPVRFQRKGRTTWKKDKSGGSVTSAALLEAAHIFWRIAVHSRAHWAGTNIRLRAEPPWQKSLLCFRVIAWIWIQEENRREGTEETITTQLPSEGHPYPTEIISVLIDQISQPGAPQKPCHGGCSGKVPSRNGMGLDQGRGSKQQANSINHIILASDPQRRCIILFKEVGINPGVLQEELNDLGLPRGACNVQRRGPSTVSCCGIYPWVLEHQLYNVLPPVLAGEGECCVSTSFSFLWILGYFIPLLKEGGTKGGKKKERRGEERRG